MKMVYKIPIAAIALLSLALIMAPAFAQFGPGIGACGQAPVAYGAPQDCIAQVSCNIPVTTQVPTMTTATVAQEVPVVVPVTSTRPVTVPRAVVVPETISVPYVTPAITSTTVPVTVPVQTSVPVTSMIPQVYTVPLGCADVAAIAPSASACGAGIGAAPYGGISGAASYANPNLQSTLQTGLASNIAQAGLGNTASWSAQAMPQAGFSGTAMPASAVR